MGLTGSCNLSNLTKRLILGAGLFCAPLILFDLGCMMFARDRLRSLDVKYFSGIQVAQARSSFDLGRGYPRHYFSADPVKGFDISKNTSKTLVKVKPSEFPPCEVWGNSLGCFDEEIRLAASI